MNVSLNTLVPAAKVVNENNQIKLIVNMDGLNDIFSLSSLSLKQGTDKLRSIDFSYDEINNCYCSTVAFYQNGSWFLNISYEVKASAIEENSLENDNIKISTSYFQNIYLGEMNFLTE